MQMESVLNDIQDNPDLVEQLTLNQIKELLTKAKTIFKKETTLLEITGNIGFIGDTHGDFNTTKKIINNFSTLDHLIFLGDYIDREPQEWGSIYNILYLLALKVKHPKHIFLLRGNHEGNYLITCHPYEFKKELIEKYGSERIHNLFEEVFSELPLMTLANNSIFASHAGIIKDGNLQKLHNIDKNEEESVLEITWSDPVESPSYRAIGKPFSQDELINFLNKIDANVHVRGHDYFTNGISLYSAKCLTIFSSREYKHMGNQGILVAEAPNDQITNTTDLTIWNRSTGSWKQYEPAYK